MILIKPLSMRFILFIELQSYVCLRWPIIRRKYIIFSFMLYYMLLCCCSVLFYSVLPQIRNLGPVVQSVVSLTSSLRVISLTVLAVSIHNILIFFAEKMSVAFALQKLLTFFQQKFQHICVSLDVNFNESLTNNVVSFEHESLTNNVVSFEQLGPGYFRSLH